MRSEKSYATKYETLVQNVLTNIAIVSSRMPCDYDYKRNENADILWRAGSNLSLYLN